MLSPSCRSLYTMSAMILVLRLCLLVAGAMALRLAIRREHHQPIAILIFSTLALEIVAALCIDSPRADLARYLAVIAISSWCALRVLGRAPPWERAIYPTAVLVLPWAAAQVSRVAWEWAPLAAHVISLGVQALSARDWWRAGRGAGPTELCALWLVGGDTAAMLGPVGLGGPWGIACAQGVLTAAAVIVLHGGGIRWAERAVTQGRTALLRRVPRPLDS